MGSIRLTAETKQQIEEAKQAYLELKSIALGQSTREAKDNTLEAHAQSAREAKDNAFAAYTAFTHTLREAYGPSWKIAGTPENEAYRKALRQVEKMVSNESHQPSEASAVRDQEYLFSRENRSPGGRGGGFGRDS
jgi:hypothetical protein